MNTTQPGHMGWGDPTDTHKQTILRERIALQVAQDSMPHKYCESPVKQNDVIEAELKKLFQFDEGFLMTVVEDMVYGTTGGLEPGPQNIGNCHKKGALLRMADGSYKPIETANVLDRVLTAEGNTGKIVQVGMREVDEPLVKFQLWGHPGISCTEEHPILTKRGYVQAKDLQLDDLVAVTKKVGGEARRLFTQSHVEARIREYSYGSKQKKVRHHMRSVGLGEYRQTVRWTSQPVPDSIELSVDFGRLIGLFLAEGSTDRARVSFSFCFEERYTLAQEVINLCQKLFGVECSVREKSGKNVCVVDLPGRDWAFLFESLCGHGAGGKKLHPDISSGNPAFMKALLGGWIDGDGYRGRPGWIQGTTVSKVLSLQMFDIANGLGLLPWRQTSKPKVTRGVKSRKQRYDVGWKEEVAGETWRGHQDDKITWRKVRSISQEHYKGPVFNLEVEGDHSYVVEGIGNHNCVGYSHCMMLGSRIAYEILVEGDPEDLFDDGTHSYVPYIPYSYGAGRVYVGGNKIRGDGSLCEWQIQGSMEYGFLPCGTPGLEGPYPQSSERVGRQFGSSKSVLDKYKPEAMKYDLVNSWDIKDVDSAKDAVLVKRAPLQICSNWGFASAGVDNRYGIEIYRRSGQWAHSMQIIGMFLLKGQWFVVVRNQWGRNYHKAPGAGVPAGSFIIPIELLASWIPNAVVMAIGELQGRQLDLNAPQV